MQIPPALCRVAMIDDNPGFLRAAERVIANMPELALAGVATDGAAGLDLVSHTSPDVVLIDIQMPGMNGFEVAERLSRSPAVPALVLISSHVDGETLREAQRVGVAAVLPKHDFVEGLRLALARATADRNERPSRPLER
jgi:DNA-binding NarL/FixJ family response regulator